MSCPDCGEEYDVPAAEQLLVEDVFDDGHPDVSISGQEHVQLECPHCGAVVGYLGVGAAAGSEETRGFY